MAEDNEKKMRKTQKRKKWFKESDRSLHRRTLLKKRWVARTVSGRTSGAGDGNVQKGKENGVDIVH